LSIEFFLSLNFDTFAHASLLVALVFARLVVVGVVAVAVLADVLTSLLLLSHLHLSVSIDKVVHVDDIRSASLALVARGVRGAQAELDQVLGVKLRLFLSSALSSNLDQRGASLVLDGVSGDPSGVALVVSKATLLDDRSLGQKAVSGTSVGRELSGDDGGRSSSKGHGGKGSGFEHHLVGVFVEGVLLHFEEISKNMSVCGELIEIESCCRRQIFRQFVLAETSAGLHSIAKN
jgi:hypothetical protein